MKDDHRYKVSADLDGKTCSDYYISIFGAVTTARSLADDSRPPKVTNIRIDGTPWEDVYHTYIQMMYSD